MKSIKSIVAICIGVLFLSSCVSTTPLKATDNKVGDKKGTSSNTCMFTYAGYYYTAPSAGQLPTSSGICFNTSDYGIRQAAEKADINKVATVDLKRTWYVLWTKYELVVTGN